MWCPKCREEYREGFTRCGDCGAELVAELPPLEPVTPVRSYGFVSDPWVGGIFSLLFSAAAVSYWVTMRTLGNADGMGPPSRYTFSLILYALEILASLGFLMSARWAFWLGILVTMPAMLGAKWLFFEYPGIWLVHPAALDVTLILYCILRLTGGLGPKPGRQGGA